MIKVERYEKYPDAYHVLPETLLPMISDIVWFNYSEVHLERDTIYGNNIWRELHHFHQMDVILDGEFRLILDEGMGEQIGRAGDAWIIPPLVKHGVISDQDFRYCSLKFHLAPQFWHTFGTRFHRFKVSPHVCALVEELGKRGIAKYPFVSQQAAAAVSCCLIELADQHPPAEDEEVASNEFRQLLWPLLVQIQREPSIKWKVAQMAGKMNLSRDYFARCFRHVIGQSPQRYVLEATMRASAAALLEIPVRPIKEIAERAGYANVHAFTRAFTQILKTTPATYRRQANFYSQ